MDWSNRLAWARPFFLEHKGAKMLSLLLAAVTWYSIRGVIGVTQQVHGIPIEVRVKGMAVLKQSDVAAVVTFRGAKEDLSALVADQARGRVKIVLYAKPNEEKGGSTMTLAIRPEDVEGVKGVRAVKVNWPENITVALDRESQEHFTVSVPRTGKPAVGQVAAVLCNPPTVRVKGPKKELDRLAAENMLNVNTEPVDLSGVVESFTRSLEVLPPSDRWTADIEPSEVAVTVAIERKPGVRTWKAVPVTALIRAGRAMKVELEPTAVDVTVTGGNEEKLGTLTADQVKVFVDCERLDMAATYNLPLTVHVSSDADISAKADPSTVRVVLREMR